MRCVCGVEGGRVAGFGEGVEEFGVEGCGGEDCFVDLVGGCHFVLFFLISGSIKPAASSW